MDKGKVFYLSVENGKKKAKEVEGFVHNEAFIGIYHTSNNEFAVVDLVTGLEFGSSTKINECFDMAEEIAKKLPAVRNKIEYLEKAVFFKHLLNDANIEAKGVVA